MAETSEKGARDAQNLAGQIQEQVRSVAAMIKTAADGAAAEAEKSQTVILALGELRREVRTLTDGSQRLSLAALEAEAASREAQKGAEIISSAAEEQAAAATEALRSVEQQSAALDESQSATQSLAALASDIGRILNGDEGADQLASAAEQLSTAVQEISGAASQIMVAVEQISRGGQQQASATQEASAAMSQIEKTRGRSGRTPPHRSTAAKRGAMLTEIRDDRHRICRRGVARSLETTRQSLGADRRARSDQPQRRQDRRRYRHGLHPDQYAGGQWLGRGGARRRFWQGLCRRLEGYPQPGARFRRECRAHQGHREGHPGSDRDGAPRARADRSPQRRPKTRRRSPSCQASASSKRTWTRSRPATSKSGAGAEAILASMKEAARGAQQVAAAAEEAGSAAAQAAAAAKQQARGAEDLAAAIEEIASLAENIQRRNG